jgi:hypothetical protein
MHLTGTGWLHPILAADWLAQAGCRLSWVPPASFHTIPSLPFRTSVGPRVSVAFPTPAVSLQMLLSPAPAHLPAGVFLSTGFSRALHPSGPSSWPS